MLESINVFFNNIGIIVTEPSDNTVRLYIRGLKNCLIVREHFLNYPLFTYKLVYFQIWSSIIDLMLSKAHLDINGINKIIALKAHFKKGLSVLLLSNFPNFIPVSAPIYNPNLTLLNYH
jgi:hypothetical protein